MSKNAKPAVVAAPKFDNQAVADAAATFAASEFSAASALETIGRVLGTSPTLPLWDAVRADFIVAYAAKISTLKGKTAPDGAAQKAWERFAARLKVEFGLEKPKATSSKATKVAAKRAAATKAAAAATKVVGAALKTGGIEAARQVAADKAAEALKAGRIEDAAAFSAAIKGAAKTADKAAATKAKAEIAALIARMRKLPTSADLKGIAAAIAAAEKSSAK
ncbi:MAG: hypothetical protein M0R28_24385 [Pigmentiphaga sp.]|nr:hypothetical protein [Pigmentiphaga sp.]